MLFRSDVFCGVTYPNGQIINIQIDPIAPNTTTVAPPYSPTAIYDIGTFQINELNNPSLKAHKRGGKYTYGIRYYDEGGRFCSVSKAFEMYLPFITEDLNVLCNEENYYDPNQYPVGTFKYGKPTITWFIDPSQKPPTWAYYYQWMRTKNSIYGNYLQWSANQVTYLSALATDTAPEIKTSYQNNDAVAIKISISNIVDYAAQNPLSNVGYAPQAGDRVRIIANRDLVFINNFQDYEVAYYDDVTQEVVLNYERSSLEIKSGMFIELLNVKNLTDDQQQIFYEVGEVYKCTAPNTPNNQHSVLTAVFNNGDTY